MVFRLRPPEKSALPRGALRLRVWRAVQAAWFERLMMVVIVLNVSLLAATWYGEPEEAIMVQVRRGRACLCEGACVWGGGVTFMIN